MAVMQIRIRANQYGPDYVMIQAAWKERNIHRTFHRWEKIEGKSRTKKATSLRAARGFLNRFRDINADSL